MFLAPTAIVAPNRVRGMICKYPGTTTPFEVTITVVLWKGLWLHDLIFLARMWLGAYMPTLRWERKTSHGISIVPPQAWRDYGSRSIGGGGRGKTRWTEMALNMSKHPTKRGRFPVPQNT